MTNTDIRTLKIFEFNRALSYISEMIEIRRKIKKLAKEEESINEERSDWEEECTKLKKEKDDIQIIVKELVEKKKNTISERENLEKYLDELEYLVSKILEFVIHDDLKLRKEEIQKSFLEEYVYLLSESFEREYMEIGKIFENKADLAFLIVENYGREKEELFSDIVNLKYDNDALPSGFEAYFSLS